MKVEIRTDNTVHIEGYVNAVERESRPVITPHGRVNEIISAGAFKTALEKAGNVSLSVDHNDKVYASTKDGTLTLAEDNIGLKAVTDISDAELAQEARAGNIKGWSFGMRNVEDVIEEREGKLPLRRVKAFDLGHITLAIRKTPIYAATSVEVRAEEEFLNEERASETEISIEVEKGNIDYTDFEKRIEATRK